MASYVNKQVIELNEVTEENRNRATRSIKTETHLSDGRLRLYRMAAVCLGVLCVLQVTLNISLRLAFSGSNEGRDQLQERYTTLATERDMLSNRVSVLTNEKGVLQNRLSGCGTGRVVEGRYMAVPTRWSMFRCPKGWRMLGSSCYFLSTETKTWQESRLDCFERGADLVIINSEEEKKLLYQLDGDADLLVWIGLTDSVNEGAWKWVDGTPLTTSYWKSGQPERGDTNNKDCVEVYHRDDVLANWNDAPCDRMLHWICEKRQK
ncbi:C-type lectin domain family 12 member B-like [Salvelinus fontinalis]|uniref:C-type lectin domain family 12 member B-like n=1 Tax=Salvelinus fontinalis TaxID=8038 RepID=UPI002484EC34|nr:C-type lectin domain family 12 member B-like [Salvelinus fontinalis]